MTTIEEHPHHLTSLPRSVVFPHHTPALVFPHRAPPAAFAAAFGGSGLIPVAVPLPAPPRGGGGGGGAPPRAVHRLSDTARERAEGSRGSAALDTGASGLGSEGGAAQV